MYKKEMSLEDYVIICDLHVKRLSTNLKKIEKYPLLTVDDLQNLTDDQMDKLDAFIMRFSQLQDTIGMSIFPHILHITGDLKNSDTFIDKLNKLEKLEYLHDAHWWRELRDLRNACSHDYANQYKKILEHLKQIIVAVPQLLEYWENLKKKLKILIQKSKLNESY